LKLVLDELLNVLRGGKQKPNAQDLAEWVETD